MSDWVKVCSAPNPTSALIMEGVLKDADIPVLIGQGAGSEVPFTVEEDFLSPGPRDVLVPEPALEEARKLLEDTTSMGERDRADRLEDEARELRERVERVERAQRSWWQRWFGA